MVIMVRLQQEIAEHDYNDDDGCDPADHEPDKREYPARGVGGVVTGKLVQESGFFDTPAGKEHHYQAAHGNEHIT